MLAAAIISARGPWHSFTSLPLQCRKLLYARLDHKQAADGFSTDELLPALQEAERLFLPLRLIRAILVRHLHAYVPPMPTPQHRNMAAWEAFLRKTGGWRDGRADLLASLLELRPCSEGGAVPVPHPDDLPLLLRSEAGRKLITRLPAGAAREEILALLPEVYGPFEGRRRRYDPPRRRLSSREPPPLPEDLTSWLIKLLLESVEADTADALTDGVARIVTLRLGAVPEVRAYLRHRRDALLEDEASVVELLGMLLEDEPSDELADEMLGLVSTRGLAEAIARGCHAPAAWRHCVATRPADLFEALQEAEARRAESDSKWKPLMGSAAPRPPTQPRPTRTVRWRGQAREELPAPAVSIFEAFLGDDEFPRASILIQGDAPHVAFFRDWLLLGREDLHDQLLEWLATGHVAPNADWAQSFARWGPRTLIAQLAERNPSWGADTPRFWWELALACEPGAKRDGAWSAYLRATVEPLPGAHGS